MVSVVGALVAFLLVLMKLVPAVPGHLGLSEYVALALCVAAGLALKRRGAPPPPPIRFYVLKENGSGNYIAHIGLGYANVTPNIDLALRFSDFKSAEEAAAAHDARPCEIGAQPEELPVSASEPSVLAPEESPVSAPPKESPVEEEGTQGRRRGWWSKVFQHK